MRNIFLVLSILFFISFCLFVSPHNNIFLSPDGHSSKLSPSDNLSDDSARMSPFQIVSKEIGTDLRFQAWTQDEQTYYFFLPSQLQANFFQEGINIYTTNDIIYNGQSIAAEHFFTVNDQDFSIFQGEEQIDFHIMTSSGLPALWLETEHPDDLEKINSSKEYTGDIQFFLLPSKLEAPSSFKAINGTMHARGNVSFTVASKKSYLLETETASDPFSMGAAQKWILLSNYFDQTMLRNYLTFYFSRELGLKFVPDSQFIDLYVNGYFIGTYLLSEKVEVHPERVAISDLGVDNISLNTEEFLKSNPFKTENAKGVRAKSPSDITGGYLLEFEVEERYPDEPSGFITRNGQCVIVQSPKYATAREIEYISELVQHFENALYSESHKDQYLQYIDLDSFTKKYLVEEISKNMDANKTSQFFYKDSDKIDNRIYAGPPWDYDKAWGNELLNLSLGDTSIELMDPDGLYAGLELFSHSIWAQLVKKDSFYANVRQQYKSLALPLLDSILENELPLWKNQIYCSAQMDWIRWNSSLIADTPNYNEKYCSSFDEAYQLLWNFIKARKDYLCQEWQ